MTQFTRKVFNSKHLNQQAEIVFREILEEPPKQKQADDLYEALKAGYTMPEAIKITGLNPLAVANWLYKSHNIKHQPENQQHSFSLFREMMEFPNRYLSKINQEN
jgi:hypothetical protein